MPWYSFLTGSRETRSEALTIVEAPKPPADAPPDVNLEVTLGSRSRYRTYPEDSIDPARYRDITRLADQGYTEWLMEIFDAVTLDAKMGSVVSTRKLAVSGAPWHLDSGDESAFGDEIKDAGTAFVKRIPAFAHLLNDLLDAPYRGWAAAQLAWAATQYGWDVVDWEGIESRLFRFDPDNRWAPLVYTLANETGEPLPPAPAVIYHVSRDKPGTVMRGGYGRSLAKLWVYKGHFLVDMASYLERFGHPLVQAEYPANVPESSPAMERIKDAVRSFAVDMGAVVPPGTVLKLIEATNKAATVRDVYLAAIEWCDECAAVCVLGGSLTTGIGDGAFGHGQEAQQHGEVRQDRKDSDAAQLCETITTQLLKPWTLYHYGPNAPVPVFCLDVAQPEDELATSQAQVNRATAINTLSAMGLPLSKEQIYDEFKLRPPENEDDTLEKPPAPEPVAEKPQVDGPQP